MKGWFILLMLVISPLIFKGQSDRFNNYSFAYGINFSLPSDTELICAPVLTYKYKHVGVFVGPKLVVPLDTVIRDNATGYRFGILFYKQHSRFPNLSTLFQTEYNYFKYRYTLISYDTAIPGIALKSTGVRERVSKVVNFNMGIQYRFKPGIYLNILTKVFCQFGYFNDQGIQNSSFTLIPKDNNGYFDSYFALTLESGILF